MQASDTPHARRDGYYGTEDAHVEIIPPGAESRAERHARLEPHIRQLQALAHIMEHALVIPGTNLRVGVDALIGLIPVVGDTISLVLSTFIFRQAKKIGLPRWLRMRMGWNIAVDWAIGLVPLVGDILDWRYRANTRNLRLILQHLERKGYHFADTSPRNYPGSTSRPAPHSAVR